MQASALTDSAVGSLATHRTWRTSETARLALSIAQQLQLEGSRRLAAASAGSSITSPKEQSSPESRPPAARPPLPRMGTRVPVSHAAAPAPRLLSHCIAAQQLEPLSAAVPAPLPHAATERRPLRRSATANLWPPATAPCAPAVAEYVDVLQEFEPEFEADAQLDAQNAEAEAEAEWVLRRRPDGSHYVAKRAVRRSRTTFVLSKAQQRRDRLARRAAQVAAERSLLTTEEENASGGGADRCFVPHTARRTHLDARRVSRNRRDFLRRLQCGRADDCKPAPQPFAQLSETFVALALL